MWFKRDHTHDRARAYCSLRQRLCDNRRSSEERAAADQAAGKHTHTHTSHLGAFTPSCAFSASPPPPTLASAAPSLPSASLSPSPLLLLAWLLLSSPPPSCLFFSICAVAALSWASRASACRADLACSAASFFLCVVRVWGGERVGADRE